MPITFDIKKDLRYQQGREEEKIEVAQALLKKDINIVIIHETTGLPLKVLQEMQNKLKA